MPRERKVTVRLSEEEYERLTEYMEERGLKNISDAVREMISPRESPLPPEFTEAMDYLVSIGYFSSREEGLREAVRVFLYDVIDLWKIRERAEALREIRMEMEQKRLLEEKTRDLLKK